MSKSNQLLTLSIILFMLACLSSCSNRTHVHDMGHRWYKSPTKGKSIISDYKCISFK